MQNRHRTNLQNKLDELYSNYKVEIPLAELRLWFEQKVTKTVWQKIDDEFKNLLREYNSRMPKYEIHVVTVNDTALLILSKYKKEQKLYSINSLM